jgi:hypothetical protein
VLSFSTCNCLWCSLPSAGYQWSDHTARRRLQAWQPIMNPLNRRE